MQKGGEGIGAEIARRLQQALVDAIEGGQQRQDQIGDIAVDEAQDCRSTSPAGW